MKRKLFSLIVLSALLFNTIGVSAKEEITITDDYEDSIPSSFLVTAEMLGYDVIVSVPSEMYLALSHDGLEFINSDSILAKGHLMKTKHLEMRIPTSTIYKNDMDTSIQVPGNLNFDVDGYAEWSSDELKDNIDSPEYKAISVAVQLEDIDYIGLYRANINYAVSIKDN